MKIKSFIAGSVLSLATLATLDAKEVAKNTEVPYYLKNYESIYKESPRKAALAWFDDARMGMFIHWGVWGKYHGEWSMYHKLIPLETYRQTAREVDASKFDANEIVKLAKASGMRYITFVAKHHDGFSLWDSKSTDWDSMDYPMKRDFVRELAKACREQEIPLMIYYSIGIDWQHPYTMPTNLYKQARPHYKVMPDYFKYQKSEDFENYREFCKQQLIELCTQYGPIAGFWFDTLGSVLANQELFKMQEFYDLIHQYQPQALIHFKTGATGTEDILVGERELRSISNFYKDTPSIAKSADDAWQKNFSKKAEIAATSHSGWAWSPKAKCQSADNLYKMLTLAADNNANLLLNFGPMPDGSIPDHVKTEFTALGKLIEEKGYPPLNKTTWIQKRNKGVMVDNTEKEKTAR